MRDGSPAQRKSIGWPARERQVPWWLAWRAGSPGCSSCAFRLDAAPPGPVVGHVHLVGAAHAAKAAAAVAGYVDEYVPAPGPLTAADPVAAALGDDVGQPGGGQRLDPGYQAGRQRSVVQ